ncbi:hypothetical protein LTR17_022031 [Elasticomyces elasticus]|nr:hypothetical protein LTR17_022031 [Elasticomyces elasticus]
MTTKLRDIPSSARYFWQNSTLAQLKMTAFDQNTEYIKRKLPEQEVCALALNEIAVEHRSGFFFHLPSRQASTSNPGEDRLPHERRVPEPSSTDYPALIYMKYAWTDADRNRFFDDPHRSRYLKASLLMNPPPSGTPLYAIQYASARNAPVYATSLPSLVLLAGQTGYHLTTTTALEETEGRSKDHKLKKPASIWQAIRNDRVHGDMVGDTRRPRHATIGQHTAMSLEEIVLAVEQRTGIAALQPTYSVAYLLAQVVPRARSDMSIGIPLGSGLSAEPVSRRGEKRQRQKRLPSGVEEEAPRSPT